MPVSIAAARSSSLRTSGSRWRHDAASIGPLERKAARIGPGVYRVHELPLRIDGVWTIVVRARIDDFTQREFATTLALP